MTDDTRIGGGRFPSTRRSLVLAIQTDSEDERRVSFDALVRSYWKPVYRYLRMKWRISSDDAEELTQGFFTHAFEKSSLDRFEPERARFRTWLRVCLDGWVANEHKAAGRLKRGGGVERLSLDFATAEAELARLASRDGDDPETWFHREWVRDLFERALADLRGDCEASGKQTSFALFERYDLIDSPTGRPPSYAELAAEFDVPVTQVTNFLAWARREFRRRVLERLREATGSEADFRAEARDVLGTDPL